MTVRRHILKLLVIMAVSLVAGCAGLGVEPLSLRDPSLDHVWPSPPAPPRIRFLREITGPDQIAPRQGKIQQFWDLVTGENKLSIPFSTPYGIVSDGGSVLFVADSSAGVVHRYDLARREVTYIFQAGEELLASPVGAAFDRAGKLYVADSVNAKVYVFSREGEFLRELGAASFQRPAGIAVNSLGEVFVVDVLAHKLKVFAEDGRFLRDFPRQGSGEPLSLPSNVAIDRNDAVYVTDSMNFTVKVYGRDGSFRRSIGEIGDAPGSFARPRGVAVDSDLQVYVIDATFDNFQIFDQEGRLLLFVGRSGKGPGEFFLPSGIFIDGNDRIFVSDTYNRRIQVFEFLKKGKLQ